MSCLILEKTGANWVKLIGPPNKSFISYLKYSIRPATDRFYSADTRVWSIMWKQLPHVVVAARRYYAAVDYSNLPESWQLYIAGAKVGYKEETDTKIITTEKQNPFEVLFVTENAPMEVIKAAYKALATKYHPDAGGNETDMSNLNLAYAEICDRQKVTKSS